MIPPPPLAWLPSFCQSTGRALGQEVSFELHPDVNPLIYKVHVQWREPVSSAIYMGIWNLFQIWANKNDAIPQGSPMRAPYSMSAALVVRRRLGMPRDAHPMS